jgi:hypothetical protein
MKGCYVHFMDLDTERFVRSRIEARDRGRFGMVAEQAEPYQTGSGNNAL